jgi:hypothetical protein
LSSPEKHPSARQAARRKLLRGAFAAPAVLTLHSAGATTAASSSLRCLTNQVNGTSSIKTVPVSNALDNWLRVPLYTTGAGTTASPYRYYIKGSDVTPFQRPGRSCFITATQSWEFNISTNTQVGTSALTGLPSGLSSSGCGKFASVRFDASGNVTGCGTGLAGTAAMPGTCWASAAPML